MPSTVPPQLPRQLQMELESARLRALGPTEKSVALSALAILLLRAAGVQMAECDDNRR